MSDDEKLIPVTDEGEIRPGMLLVFTVSKILISTTQELIPGSWRFIALRHLDNNCNDKCGSNVWSITAISAPGHPFVELACAGCMIRYGRLYRVDTGLDDKAVQDEWANLVKDADMRIRKPVS